MESAAQGIDIFRVFDALNWLPNMKHSDRSHSENEQSVRGFHLLYRRHSRPQAGKISPAILYSPGKRTRKNGRAYPVHQGYVRSLKPYAAERLFTALSEEIGLPLHFHTHDTSGVNAAAILKASGSRRARRGRGHCFHERHDEPAEPQLHRGVASTYPAGHRPRPRRAQCLRRLLGDGSDLVPTFDNAPPAGTAEVYLHEMPGGQYTNLREQAESMGLGPRWQELAQTYAEVNFAFGDIVKVTPSSKVVGDMAIFLVSHDMTVKDLEKLGPDHNLRSRIPS